MTHPPNARRPRGRPRKPAPTHPAYLPANENSFGQRQRAWVVFTDEGRIWWLKWLRPGFRHCFAILNDGAHWVAAEPLAHCLECSVLPSPPDFNLPAWLAAQGHRVVETPLNRKLPTHAPLAFLNCVEVVKRIIGLRAPWVMTPYQLYRHLTHIQNQPQLQNNRK